MVPVYQSFDNQAEPPYYRIVKKKRSHLEHIVQKWLDYLEVDASYESIKIPYQLNYLPDWVVETCRGTFYIEAKGILSTRDMTKYLAVKKELKKGEELVFVFGNPAAKVQRRSATHAEWADSHEFTWFDVNQLGKLKEYVNP